MEARRYYLNVDPNDDDLVDMHVTDDIGQDSLVCVTAEHALEIAERLRAAAKELESRAVRPWARDEPAGTD